MRIEWTAKRKDIVRRLWQCGYSARAIAGRIDVPVTRSAVIGLVNRHRDWGRSVDWKKPNSEPPPPAVPKAPSPPPPEGLLIEQLRSHHCRWPRGDRAPYVFCGATADFGSPYCSMHKDMARPAGARR